MQPHLSEADHLEFSAVTNANTQYELLRQWYISRDFHFYNNRLLRDLLAHDFWDLDLPVHDLVRKISVEVWDSSMLYDQGEDRVSPQRRTERLQEL